MAGTDEDAVATGDDDALYVLTAVLLTPAKFPSVLGDDYPEACATLDLAPLAEGYGLVLGQDGEGARWTVVIDDVSLVAVAIASWDCGMEHELSPDERTVVAALPGWPLDVAVSAPGIPAPHDPSTELTERPPLSPPDTATWGRLSDASARTRSRSSGRHGASRSTTVSSRPRTAPRRPRPRTTPRAGTRAVTARTAPVFAAFSPRRARMWTHRLRWAVSARPSPRATLAPCEPTAPAGLSSPGPTTSRSSCSTRNPARSCPSAADRNCPASWKPWTRWRSAPAE